MRFATPFDDLLAHHGPAAIFLSDKHGCWRLDESWTRDAWGREPGPHVLVWTWCLLRDRATGFVTLALSTSDTLLASHPRMDVRRFESLEAALAAREAFGSPPVSREVWA